MAIRFNEKWLKKATIKKVKEVFKSDKYMRNKALSRRKELRKK